MIQLVQFDEKSLQLSLTDLLSLKDAQLPGGAFAMRPLNQAHVQQLVESSMEKWPAIDVTRCTDGYIVIDGYHRWEAATIQRATLIKASCQSYPDANAVINAAFRANLTHGLKASLATRGDYAYWLHKTFPSVSQEKIAQLSGLTQGAVSKAIAKRERAVQQAVQEGPPDPRTQRKLVRRSLQRVTREASCFLREVTMLSEEEVAMLLTPEARTILSSLGHLLATGTPASLPDRPSVPSTGHHSGD